MAEKYRLYQELSYLWPLISPASEYAEEAAFWSKTLKTNLGLGPHSILDLGVGGGHLLSHLTYEYQATGVDLSPKMLALSKELNPDVTHHIGDMRNIRLGKKYDAVLIHDSISYLLSEQDLSETFETAKQHLRVGGILLLGPEWTRETFPGTTVMHWIKETTVGELTCIEHLHDPDPEDTTIESTFFYLWNDAGQLRIEEDHHTTGLFSRSIWIRLLESIGFTVSEDFFPRYEGGYGGHLIIEQLNNT